MFTLISLLFVLFVPENESLIILALIFLPLRILCSPTLQIALNMEPFRVILNKQKIINLFDEGGCILILGIANIAFDTGVLGIAFQLGVLFLIFKTFILGTHRILNCYFGGLY